MRVFLGHLNSTIPLCIIKNKFHTKNRGAPKSVGPVAVATFATIVNLALLICPHMHKDPSILAIFEMYQIEMKNPNLQGTLL